MHCYALKLLCLTLITLGVHACDALDKTNKPNVNAGAQALEPTDTSSRSASAKPTIRQTDFKNFTYPWYPSYLKSRDRSQIALRNGKFEVAPTKQTPMGYLLIELDDVSYADLLQNGDEEAIIYLRGISGVNRFVGCFFVYTLDGNVPKLLWQYETGDRADGGLQKMDIENQSLVIEQYTLDGAAGLCCPKNFVRKSFKWDGKEFRAVKSVTLPVEEKTRQ